MKVNGKLLLAGAALAGTFTLYQFLSKINRKSNFILGTEDDEKYELFENDDQKVNDSIPDLEPHVIDLQEPEDQSEPPNLENVPDEELSKDDELPNLVSVQDDEQLKESEPKPTDDDEFESVDEEVINN